MNRKICQYSIIRFMPFVETEEFANIGIVVYLPETKELHFKLLSAKEHGRISHFFEPLKKVIFTGAVQIIHEELTHIQSLLINSRQTKINLYEDLIRPREDIIQYSQNRALFSMDVAKTVDDLFDHYVKHRFAYEKSYEEKICLRIKNLLKQEQSEKEFKQGFLGDKDKYAVTFPFVNSEEAAAIKPIHFRHQDSNKLIEHGSSWLMKIQQLQRRQFIKFNDVLFAYQPPKNEQGILFDAFKDIKSQIEEVGIQMVSVEKGDEIIDFTRQYI